MTSDRHVQPKRLAKGDAAARGISRSSDGPISEAGWRDCFIPVGMCSGQRLFCRITRAHMQVFRIPDEHVAPLFGAWTALVGVMASEEGLEADFNLQVELMHASLKAGGQGVSKRFCKRWVEMMCSAFLQKLDDLSEEDAE